MSIFKNCSVVLVLKDLPFKEKNRMKLAIIENGGIVSHVVNKQCSLIVTNCLTSLSSSRLRCILKHHTPVVGLDYVTQCLEKGVRLAAEEYCLAPPPPPCHLLLASPSSVPVSHGPEIKIGVSNPVEEQFKVQKTTHKSVNQSKRAGNEDNETHAFQKAVRVCTEEGNEFPTFPTSFQVAKYCIFRKDQSRTWSVLELQSGRGEGGQQYRVVHLWREDSAKSSAPKNKVVLVSTSERAIEIYQGLRKELQAKGLTLSSSLPDDVQGLVSTSLQQLLLEEKLNCGALTKEVCVFVELLWKEALGCLDNVLKVPVESLSLNDVSRAEGLLLQAQRILREAKNGELTSLMEDVYSLLPHRLACPPVDAKLISQKLDLCQLIRDILNVSEFTLRSPVPSCLGKYRALRCGIDIVPPGTPEFHVVSNLLHDRKVQILQVLRVRRGVELQMFKEQIGHIKPLLHSSRPSSFVGILSRGLLLPRVGVEHHGIERTDIGNLGSGIYFSDSMSTSLKYSKPIETDGSRLLLVCDVALGSCRDLHKRDTRLSQAPEGYQSVHGVSRTPKVQSDFKDDEYVVYSPDQVKLKYVVQFSVEEDQLKEFSPAIEASLELPQPRSNFELGAHEEDVGICKNPLDDVTAGLLDSSGQPLPLQAVHVKCKLMDLLCQVIIFQRYTNQRSIPIEAKYVFPLDDSAAVCGFEAFINGKHVVGKVKEKEQARKDYKQAIEKGHGAYLMDQDAPNVFTISVGNLPPDATVLIKITFVTELVIRDGTVLFSLPGSVAPWQQNAALNQTTQATVEKVCVTDVATQGEFTLDMSVEMPYEILDLSCTTHKVKVKQTACKAVVSVLPGETMGSNGFELSFILAKSHLPRMWVENHPDKDSQACMLVFYPDFEVQPDLDFSSSEVILLLDTSESMIGEALQNARRVALQILKIINPSLRVNVISFGTDYNEALLSARPLLEALQPIKKFISTSPPVGGTTDLWRALRSLSLLPPSRGVRNLLLLSDGHIQNQSLTLQLVRDSSQHSRLFTCGLSPSANRHMLRALSQAGGGAYELFDTKTKHTWAEKVESQVKRMASPGCSSVSVKWQQFNPRAPPPVQAPAQLNALFSNCHNLVYGFVPHCTQATLFGDLSGQEIQTMVSTSELQKTKGTFLHKLTARAVIRDYEDGSLAPDEAEHEEKKSELKSYIIELSKEFSILSQYTSFVAIEERDPQQLDVGFTDVAKLIAEEDVDFLPYLSWKEEEDVVGADIDDEEIECDYYQSLEESSVVWDLTEQVKKQGLRKKLHRSPMRMRCFRSLPNPLAMDECFTISKDVQTESSSPSPPPSPLFGSFLTFEELASRPAAPPLPFYSSPCPPPPSHPCPPPPPPLPLVQPDESLDLMDFSAMFLIPGSVALECNKQGHPNQMPVPPHLAPFDTKEQQLYYELPPDDRALCPVPKAEPSHPMEETHFRKMSRIQCRRSRRMAVPVSPPEVETQSLSIESKELSHSLGFKISPSVTTPGAQHYFEAASSTMPRQSLLLESFEQVPQSNQSFTFGVPAGAATAAFGGYSVPDASVRYAAKKRLKSNVQSPTGTMYGASITGDLPMVPPAPPLQLPQAAALFSSRGFYKNPLYDQHMSSNHVPRSSRGVIFGGPRGATHTGFGGGGGRSVGGGGSVFSKQCAPLCGGMQQQEVTPYLKTKFIPSVSPPLNQQGMQTPSSTRVPHRSLDFRKSSLDQVQIQWTHIFGMQHSEGYWECNESLGVLIGLDVHMFANVFLKNKGICSLGVRAHADILKLVATLLVLQLMRVKKLDEGKLLLSLFRLDDAPQQRSERWKAVKKAVDWVRWADRQYPCVCSRLEFGWDWESSTRQLLGVDPPKPFSPLSRMGSSTEPKIFLGLVAAT